jgi:hypothetical protein
MSLHDGLEGAVPRLLEEKLPSAQTREDLANGDLSNHSTEWVPNVREAISAACGNFPSGANAEAGVDDLQSVCESSLAGS